MAEPANSVEVLIDQVRSSKKYAQIDPTLVARIAAEELPKHKDLKTAAKSTRTRLHRLTGAFLDQSIDYAQWLEKFKAHPEDGLMNECGLLKEMMRLHASTKERLPFLEAFFAQTLQAIAPIRSVLDLACGLNPLAAPFMPLGKDAVYLACDVVEPEINFFNAWFQLRQSNGRAFLCDLLDHIPQEQVQLTLVLKTLPILDQIDPNFSSRLLTQLQSEHILISYPTKSLGGRAKGMQKTYMEQFQRLTQGRDFTIQRFEFSNEIAFLLSR